MVDLTKINLATDDDKLYERDLWAKFFKATTWEDLSVKNNSDELLFHTHLVSE